MEINNEIRRTRLKARILLETPNIEWVLDDILNEYKNEFEKEDGKFPPNSYVIEKLRLIYMSHIDLYNRLNSSKQQKLFEDEQ